MSHLTVLVELPNGQKRWYCLAKKVTRALKLEWKMGNKHNFDLLRGNYIIVPYSNYNAKRHAKLTVGRVVTLRWYHKPDYPKLYTRSQFITPDRLEEFKLAYRYLRHDYRKINRLRIALALLYWRNKRRRKISWMKNKNKKSLTR